MAIKALKAVHALLICIIDAKRRIEWLIINNFLIIKVSGTFAGNIKIFEIQNEV